MNSFAKLIIILVVFPGLILMQDLPRETTTTQPVENTESITTPLDSTTELPTVTPAVDQEGTTVPESTTTEAPAGDGTVGTTTTESPQTTTEDVEAPNSSTLPPDSIEQTDPTVTTASPTITTTVQSPGICTCECPILSTDPTNEPTTTPTSAGDDNEGSGANSTPSPSTPTTVSPETPSPLPQCTEIGDFPDPTDCQRYYSCSGGPTDFVQTELTCPPKNAYSSVLGRCTRDVSSCGGVPDCVQPGNIADPNGNTSYYWCVADGLGGYHKFHIQCEKFEIYLPQIAKCFVDLQFLAEYSASVVQGVLSDRDVVKAEVKLLKEEDKAKVKEEKLRQKLEEKIKKEADKLAQKELKRQQKEAEKAANASGEGAEVCTDEGNFAVEGVPGRYYSCVSKKGKWKKVSMKCPPGQSFDSTQSACSAGNA